MRYVKTILKDLDLDHGVLYDNIIAEIDPAVASESRGFPIKTDSSTGS